MNSNWFQWQDDILLLQLRIQPKASTDAWAGSHGDYYRLRITAPPVDGKANQHLTKLLSKAFGVPKNRVILIQGETSRNKRFKIIQPNKIPHELKPQLTA